MQGGNCDFYTYVLLYFAIETSEWISEIWSAHNMQSPLSIWHKFLHIVHVMQIYPIVQSRSYICPVSRTKYYKNIADNKYIQFNCCIRSILTVTHFKILAIQLNFILVHFQINKSSPRRTHCKLWVCFLNWWLRQMQEVQHLPGPTFENYPSKLGCHTLGSQATLIIGLRFSYMLACFLRWLLELYKFLVKIFQSIQKKEQTQKEGNVRKRHDSSLFISNPPSPEWHSLLTVGQSEQLERQQTQALKNVYGIGKSARAMRKESGLKRLWERREEACRNFTYKSVNNIRCRGWFEQRERDGKLS